MTDNDLYDGPVIDAHIHLWDLEGDHYPWLMPGGSFGPEGVFDSLKYDYVLEDYRRDIAGQNVVASVHIEALWSLEDGQVNETKWLESLDKSDNLAIRYVVGAPFGVPESEKILREHAEFSRAKAVRQTIAWNPNPKATMMPEPYISRKPEWRKTVELIDELGLMLELLIYPWQANEVVELAELHPGLTIIVDHIASPINQTPDALAEWEEDVKLLATKPNILIKVSSVAGYIENPTLEKVSYFIRHVVDSFGADRAMIASDFPPGSLAGLSYAEVYEMYRQSVKHYSREEQYALFCGTAARVYDIPIDDILENKGKSS